MDASPEFPRQSRVPVFNMPGIVTLSIGLLLAIQAVREFLLPDTWDISLVLDLALVPARWTLWFDPGQAAEVIRAAGDSGDPGLQAAREAFARYIAGEHAVQPWTLATYALLHGSWMHVIFNSVWLAAFGSPVARRCGAWRYGVIALAGTAAGGLLHVLVDPLSAGPLVGASAGISALMAAAARFVFQPPVSGYAGPPWQLPPRRPVETIPELLRNRTAVSFLAIWLVTNLLFGLISVPFVGQSAAIAWDAHLGGFIVGFLMFPFLDPREAVKA
ncbi:MULTISPECIES: rhomboid family intramembrane serine protease [unclassified Methylobacterium]|jgi:membrane associated rhomboid family serine protease|uniref:rhomboid family intramembrane serine protease n=1 Tax=unclassified Methylobacterium TaxID=2615210 RepID=UPI001355F206|nr:rhomboid family intramembrane serine protease [Methylobacterium sp. 2A]MWV24949.1 rhomboid family intramembrane serine protease [Methylobacterium sp. 2A]